MSGASSSLYRVPCIAPSFPFSISFSFDHEPRKCDRQGVSSIQISASTSTGTVNAAAISTITSVGAFKAGPDLSYTPLQTQAAVAITIAFSTYMDLAQSDSVFFALPGFQAGESSFSITVNSGNIDTTASWNQATHTLTLVSSGSNTAESDISVTLPSSIGIRLPSAGLTLNQEALTFSCNANTGPVLATSIPSSNSVGVLSSFSLTFQPRLVGSPTSLVVSMVLNVDLEQQDTVSLILPGFLGTSMSSLSFAQAATDGNFVQVTGSWNLDTTTLTVQLQSVAHKGKTFSFTVDATNNLKLPAAGIQQDHTGFFFSTDAANGRITSLPVSAQLVTFFANQSISFSNAAATMPCGVHFNFSLTCPLAINDSIVLRLPAFTGLRVPALTISQTGSGGNSALKSGVVVLSNVGVRCELPSNVMRQ